MQIRSYRLANFAKERCFVTEIVDGVGDVEAMRSSSPGCPRIHCPQGSRGPGRFSCDPASTESNIL